MNEYQVGDLVKCSGTFTVGGTPTDPTITTFRFMSPDHVLTSYVYNTDAQLVRDSAGVFHVNLSVTLSGIWHFRFEGTGAAQAADESEFFVEESFA